MIKGIVSVLQLELPSKGHNCVNLMPEKDDLRAKFAIMVYGIQVQGYV